MLGAAHDANRSRCICQDLPQAMALRLSFRADLRDVAEDQRNAANLRGIVSNRSRAAADQDICAISAKEQCVTSKLSGSTCFQYLSHRIDYRQPGIQCG